MERSDFLKSLGLGVALVCTGSCLSGCGSKSDDAKPGGGGGGGGPTPGTKIDVDLTTQLLTVGSAVSTGGILFIRTASGNSTSSFVATQAVCPHQGGSLNWVQANNLIQCSLHSSKYSTTGSVLAQPNDGGTTTALRVYSTSITGNILSVTVS